MRRRDFYVLVMLMLTSILQAQVPGYYNGTAGKNGEELKSVLNDIISNHVDFSYSDAKYIMNYADSDPANENNVILFYTKRSQSNDSWGSGGNDINREHVWAKSHGDFSDIRPMDGDAFNLHPSDASVNILKSNYDFDECSDAGTYIDEADAYYTSNQFEPADAAKGEVARTIFYMSVRYEGENGELDLEAVDNVGTYPTATHGKLSTLLEWNRDFPPNDLERRRNERVYEAQNNRNPFIDNPDFADLIWGDASVPGIIIGDITLSNPYPDISTSATLSVDITGNTSAQFYLGGSYDSNDNEASMSQSGDTWSTNFDVSAFSAGSYVYYKIVATDGTSTEVFRGTYKVPGNSSLTDIASVQGTGTSTPMSGSTVTIGGIITANFDNSYYIQNGSGTRGGICVYDIRRGNIGDSVVVRGKPTEYQNLTELANVDYFYVYEQNTPVEPPVISISDIGEDYEGMLVKFNNVTFLEGDTKIPVSEATTLNFTDGSDQISVYCRYNSRLGGEIVPSGTVNVTGIVSQYQTNYQILIHSIDYIQAGDDNEAPMLTAVTVNDATWIELSFNEKIEKTSAETISNYSITDDVTISGAYIYNDTKVLLMVSGLKEQDYTITVTGIQDLSGNTLTETSMQFHSDYTAIEKNIRNNKVFKFYPNPASTFFKVELNENFSGAVISLRDLSGRVVLNEEVSAAMNELYFDISDIASGTYLLAIEKNGISAFELIEILK